MPAVERLLEIETESLPILWDCDFLHRPAERHAAKIPMFFAKSMSAALRRIPNLRCLTSSMRQPCGYKRRERDATPTNNAICVWSDG